MRLSLLTLLCHLLASTTRSAEIAVRPEVTSLHDFGSLDATRAREGLSVGVSGVVVCYDADWNQLYIHDGVETSYFDPKLFSTQPSFGQSVKISGTTIDTNGLVGLGNAKLSVLGPGKIPLAKVLAAGKLDADYGQWVSLTGGVRAVEVASDRLRIMLQCAGGIDFLVHVMGLPKSQDYRWLLDRSVQVRGINATKAEGGSITRGVLFSPGADDLKLLDQAGADPLAAPVRPIGPLLRQELGPWTNNRVHVSGTASATVAGASLMITDPTGTIMARTTQVEAVEQGERVDVWGFLVPSRGGPFLDYAYFARRRSAQPNSPPVISGGLAGPSSIYLPLTNISDVVKLPQEEAKRGLPISVRGVVTFADTEWGTGFIQDSGSAMFFALTQKGVRPGQWVELTGETGPGGFIPEAAKAKLEILGMTNLPVAERVGLEELASGKLDSHWVEMRGVVRRVDQQWGHARLVVATRSGRFKALIPGLDDSHPPLHLIDSVVSIQGACGSELNALHQLVGVMLQVPSLEQVKVIEAAPEAPFEASAVPIRSVATFDSSRAAGRRLKVRGVVSLPIPGDGFVMQDASGGIRVHSTGTNQVAIGSVVEALGFPALGGFSPALEEAVAKVVGAGSISPVQTSAEEIIRLGTNDQEVVTIRGRLLQGAAKSASPELIVQDGGVIFSARAQSTKAGSGFFDLEEGSLVEVTGVCSIQAGELREPSGFHMMIRDAGDVKLMQKPKWWRDSRVKWVAAGLFAAVLLVAAWSLMLSRKNRELGRAQEQLQAVNDELESRVARRTSELTREVEFRQNSEKALAEERQLLRTLIDSLPLCLYIKDTEGRFVVSNLAHRRLRGLESEADVLGKTVFDFCPVEVAELYDKDDRVVFQSGEILDAKEEPAGVAGGNHWQATTKIPLRDLTGKLVGLVGISQDITEKKQARAELERVNRKLVDASRLAGMAEVATGVLHNVGNVLNSVNISVTVLGDQVRKSEISTVAQLATLLGQHRDNLGAFLTNDPKGRLIPDFLQDLSRRLESDQDATILELESLSKNVEHIKAIVAMQQGYTRGGCVLESRRPCDLVDDAIEIKSAALKNGGVEVVRMFEDIPALMVDRHKFQQILVNLIANAQQAMEHAFEPSKKVVISLVKKGEDWVEVSVRDQGIGIAPDNMVRIFTHGFTTKRDGHGFGLHSAALAARQMGGSLACQSEGLGKGSTFTLVLPMVKASNS